MKHRDIQSAHEKSVLDSFESYLKEQGVSLKVIEYPDPPDALVEIDGEACWIEITDAFQSSEWARSITSYAAEDKEHKPYESRVIYEPDKAACWKVEEVILKKYDKESIKKVMHSNGQGILLVGAYTPLTFPEEIIELGGESILSAIEGKNAIFQSIYLYRNSQDRHLFSQLM